MVIMEKQRTIAELRDIISADLEKLGLADSTVYNFKLCVNRFRKHLEEIGAPDYYDKDIAAEYLEGRYGYPACVLEGRATSWVQTNATSVNRLAEYGLYGAIKVGDRRNKRNVGRWAGADEPWVTEFLALDRKNGNSKNTTTVRYNAIQHFYEYLIFRNVDGVKAVTGKILSDFGTTREGYSINYVHILLRDLRVYLRYLFSQGYIENDISQNVPQVRSRQNLNMPTLWTVDELKQLLNSIDRGNATGKRDFAILLLLVQYGIRASDVAGLKLEHLNWQQKIIEFAQHKTGKKVSYPILDDVGWALIEYLRDGRPNIDNPYVFLIHVGVPKEFSGGGSLCGVLLRQMKLSGLRKEAPRTSIGSHSLRHAVARRLVSENVDLETASNILGNTTLKAASIYLRSDIDGLRECALDIEGVSVNVDEE